MYCTNNDGGYSHHPSWALLVDESQCDMIDHWACESNDQLFSAPVSYHQLKTPQQTPAFYSFSPVAHPTEKKM